MEERFHKGIKILEEYGFLRGRLEGITLHALQGDCISVEKSDSEITITYDKDPHFYMALARSIVLENGFHAIDASRYPEYQDVSYTRGRN